MLAENGRGLLLAHRPSQGHCPACPATTLTTALPIISGNRLIFPPLPDLGPGLAELRRWSSA